MRDCEEKAKDWLGMIKHIVMNELYRNLDDYNPWALMLLYKYVEGNVKALEEVFGKEFVKDILGDLANIREYINKRLEEEYEKGNSYSNGFKVKKIYL